MRYDKSTRAQRVASGTPAWIFVHGIEMSEELQAQTEDISGFAKLVHVKVLARPIVSVCNAQP